MGHLQEVRGMQRNAAEHVKWNSWFSGGRGSVRGRPFPATLPPEGAVGYTDSEMSEQRLRKERQEQLRKAWGLTRRSLRALRTRASKCDRPRLKRFPSC